MKPREFADQRKFWLISLLFIAASILIPAAVSYTQSDYTLTSEPTAIAIHPDTETAIISHEKDDSVTLLNLDHFEEAETITVGRAPKGVAVNEANNTALVSNSKDQNLSVIDLDHFRALYSITVGDRPQAVAVDPSRNRGVVANRQDGTISDLDLYDAREETFIKMDRLPIDVALDPTLNYAVVVDDVSPVKDTVSVIDLNSRQIIKKVPVGRGPVAVDIDPDTHTAVVANERDSTLTVISLDTWKYFQIPLGHRPSDVALSRVTGQALVLSQQDKLLLAVDLATGEISNTYPVKRKATALAISPYSNRAAVIDSSDNSLSVIQLDNPVPELQGVTPAAADVFSVPETITLAGNRFLKFSQVLLEKDGAVHQLPCRFINPHTLEADLPAEVRNQPGLYTIWVENPEPAGGSSNSVDFQVRNVIKIEITSPAHGSEMTSGEVEVSGSVLSGYAITAITVNDVVASYEAGLFTATVGLVAGENTLTAIVRDAGGDIASSFVTVNYTPKQQVPDPSEVAPPLDQTVFTDMAVATEFIYTGPNPVQTGVEPGTIEPRRVAVLRGKVMDRENSHLPGVVVTVLNHPEYGRTFSRVDGMFDLAVNGGGLITLNYEKEGYLPVQRQVQAPWRDYAWAADVVMIPVDSKVTVINLSAQTIQVARGTVVEDADGSRQATLMFAPGTTAAMVLPDGSKQPLSTISVRATEYTVGENGPDTMPAALPPTSGYTYAVELSADEAITAGATRVEFDRPVFFYVENFIGFPVGGIVPVGWYDREKAAWIPSANGRVVGILAIENGLAVLDIDGSGNPASNDALVALGVTDEERARLAELHTPGLSLWRVPVEHFTPWDCNWPWGLSDDAEPPKVPEPEMVELVLDPETECGSIIECQNQVLGQSLPVTGTPFTLNYRSSRVPGNMAAHSLYVPLSGASIPASLKRIELKIAVGGQQFRQAFPTQPNQSHHFAWDGKDAFARTLHGIQAVTVSIGYVYQAVYCDPAISPWSFGISGARNIAFSGNRKEGGEYTMWRESKRTVESPLNISPDLGGWSIDTHHLYSVANATIYLGDGTQYRATGVGDIITTVAGRGLLGYWKNWSGDGGLATQGLFEPPEKVVVGPDGSFYFVNMSLNRVRRVGPDGIVTTVADGLVYGIPIFVYQPVTQAYLKMPSDIALGPDGSLYIAETGMESGDNRIRRVGPDGIISTVAGGGAKWSPLGDGGPARGARLSKPQAVAVGPDGSLYIADSGNHRIRRVGPDGIITTVAGTGVYGYGGDGGLAAKAMFAKPYDVALGPDGSLYISDTYNYRVRRVGPDGIVTTVAGTGVLGSSGDGGPATQAMINAPKCVEVGADGSLYLSDTYHNRIRRVGPDGIITPIAGTGVSGYGGDSGPATQALLNEPRCVALGPDGNLYIADYKNYRIRKLSSRLGEQVGSTIDIAAADGREIYIFDSLGRHQQTLDSTTGALRYRFSYDLSGYLSTIEDGDNNITRIEHGVGGVPLAIVAPGGQRTELSLDSNGFLSTVTNPAGDTQRMNYTADGLLTDYIYPRGNASSYSYDNLGRLVGARNPEGGGWALSRSILTNGYEATMTSVEGLTKLYKVENLSIGDKLRTSTRPDGTVTQTRIGPDGRRTVTAADGTVTLTVPGPDPRFGMAAPVPTSSTVSTPGGLISQTTTQRTATFADQSDLLGQADLTETVTVNGRYFVNRYTTADNTWTQTTPTGRAQTMTLNTQGRIERSQVSGLDPTSLSYDSRGRLTNLTQGSNGERNYGLSYNAEGWLSAITDPLARSTTFDHDPAGRITHKTLPDGREVNYQYDLGGNLVALIPPGREAHLYEYDGVDHQTAYASTDLSGIETVTHYRYNLDRKLTAVERPDGRTVSLGYDAGGRLSATDIERGSYQYTYYPSTGKPASITAPDGNRLAYTWNGFLPLAETWSGEFSGSVNRTYDNNFRLTGLAVNGQTTAYSYDNDGLLIGAGALSLNRNSQNGLLSATTLGNTATANLYNGFGELTTNTATIGAAEIARIDYTRDALGRITEMTEIIDGTTVTHSFDYDQAGRLISATRNGSTTIWSYDENGNRIGVNGTSIASYDAQDKLVTYGAANYTYTEAGELKTKTESGATTTYDYDELGNLLQVAMPGDTVIDYIIDGNNRRIGKKIDGTKVQGFLYQDNLNPVAELDGAGQVVSRFVYADRSNVPSYVIKGGATYRIISDHLGSPRLVVDATTGAIAQRIDYDEFGKVLEDTNPGFQPFGYAGGLNDLDTGLVRFGTRDYDPLTGRWTSKDPILFAGGDTNLYGYVQNNPVNFIDPMGLEMFRPDNADYYVGRDGVPLFEPGEAPMSWLEDSIPYFHDFGYNHDATVEWCEGNNVPDVIANIPTMPFAYGLSVVDNALQSVGADNVIFPAIKTAAEGNISNGTSNLLQINF